MALNVYFNTLNASANILTNTFGEITMTIPNLPSGIYYITIQNEDGTSMPYAFEVLNNDASYDYEFIDDHSQQAYDRLLWQYRKDGLSDAEYLATNAVRKLIDAIYIVGLQNIEELLKTIVNRNNIDLCHNGFLEGIGSILGLDRNGMDYDTYRIYLKGKIGVNNSKGRIDDIYSLWKIFSNATSFQITELPPRAISLQSSEGIDLDYVEDVKYFIKQALPIGKRLEELITYVEGNAFTFGGVDGEVDTLTGFGSATDSVSGGYLATLL